LSIKSSPDHLLPLELGVAVNRERARQRHHRPVALSTPHGRQSAWFGGRCPYGSVGFTKFPVRSFPSGSPRFPLPPDTL